MWNKIKYKASGIYLRYMLETHCEMFERWETILVHVILFIFLTSLTMFNNEIVLPFTKIAISPLFGIKSEDY